MAIIRNMARTSEGQALNVIAHLEFFKQAAPSKVLINEAWWREDEKYSTTFGFYIARDETKHIVISGTVNSKCFAMDKKWSRSRGRYVISDTSLLDPGTWKLTIEVTADHAREVFYSEGEINSDGTSRWTDPTTKRPEAWKDLLTL
jgi:hypothetical protein